MKCNICGVEITSDKIFAIHRIKCKPEPKSKKGEFVNESMTKAEILTLAEEKGIKVDEKATKKELIEAINEAVG